VQQNDQYSRTLSEPLFESDVADPDEIDDEVLRLMQRASDEAAISTLKQAPSVPAATEPNLVKQRKPQIKNE
jgi:hypothetical protein